MDQQIPAEARGYEHHPGRITERTNTSERAWRRPRKAAEGSPNVILVLVDDLGFSDIGPFGGEIDTPNLDRLAREGVRFTNYHTNPVCSPARASLLTGLNPHRAGFSDVAHSDPGFPNTTLELPEDAPTIAESFRAAGYFTAAVGKWHLSKESHMHDGADQGSWPIQRGFDRYFGHLDGFTQLFHPHRLTRDNTTFVPDFSDDDYLTDVLTDEALQMLKSLRANEPTRPFFLYFAHTAVHAPLQAKPAEIEKYREAYAAGWDRVRAARFERQRELGIVPETAVLSDAADAGSPIQPWEELDDAEKARFARYMQVYAAAVDSVDQSLGRIIEYLETVGEYENTIIAFTSDNGASGEGGMQGTRSYFSQFIELPELPEGWFTDRDTDLDEIGGPASMIHYPKGWANVSTTPYRFYKASTYGGGVRAPLIVNWPAKSAEWHSAGGTAHLFSYVTDLGLSLLELAEVPRLEERLGEPAMETDGVPSSILAGLTGDERQQAVATQRAQHWEYLGNRAIIQGQYKAVAQHTMGAPLNNDDWRLYNLVEDPSETRDLAQEYPETLESLVSLWYKEAWRNTVFPVDDDGSKYAYRPPFEADLAKPITLLPGTPPLERYRSGVLISERATDIVARIAPANGAPMQGVVFAHGDQGGGYLLRINQGVAQLVWNEYGKMHLVEVPVDVGNAATITVELRPTPGVRLDATLTVNENSVTLPSVMRFIGLAPFSGISVGHDAGNRVDRGPEDDPAYGPFQGELLGIDYIPGERYDDAGFAIGAMLDEQARLYD